MDILEFLDSPTKKDHKVYSESLLRMRPAPENAPGEVITASLYRSIGFKKYINEKDVPRMGKELEKNLARQKRDEEKSTKIDLKTWRFVIDKLISSPKQPSQPKRKFLQFSPIIPDAAIYSMAARLRGNPWRPGGLIERIVELGSSSKEEASQNWGKIFSSLEVNQSDDIWARFLAQEFSAWRPANIQWEYQDFEPKFKLDEEDFSRASIPARQFVRDLGPLLSLKDKMTRRQWVSAFEAFLRLSAGAHVLWLCYANKTTWQLLKSSLGGTPPPDEVNVRESIFSTPEGLLRYGEQVTPTLKRWAREYIEARIAINYLLYLVEELQAKRGVVASLKLTSTKEIRSFSMFLYQNRNELGEYDKIVRECSSMLEKDPNLASCKKGITSNIVEFLRYSLGQRPAANEDQRNYDQGYWIRKKGNYKAAPWVVAGGPISLMVTSYLCHRGLKAPRTIEDFCNYLKSYGIVASTGADPLQGPGQSLRNIGLVIDSPDAEGGMIINNPFA